MSERFNVCTPRPRKDKTYWHTIGSAFKDEKGITVYLDSAPYPDAEGRVVLKLFEPREDNDRGRSAGNDRQQSQHRSRDFNDDPPF